jgi:glycosyltransferase involved in cell wall biosynthesis
MSSPPLVSVVIPTYQRAALLEEAVRSVLAQRYAHLEVLVEDDGSTDESGAAMARLADPRISYRWAPNVGRPAPVRNRGVARARGSLVAFLDSDDVWEPGKLEAQVAALEQDPTLLAVSCEATWVPARKQPVIGLDGVVVRPTFAELLQRNLVMTSGMVVRREALAAVGGFDESPELRAVEDLDLWLRLLRHRDRSIALLPQPLLLYRYGDGISLRGRRELEAVRRIAAKHPGHEPDAVRRALAVRERNVRQGELRDGLRDGTLPLVEWLRAPEVPLRRRLRLGAKALLLGRERT